MGIGLFTREELKQQALGGLKGTSNLSVERLRELGIKAVENMNPAAKTKHMAPSGSKEPILYVLGDYPTEEDDSQGKPFTGDSGQLLRYALPSGVDVRFNHCCRTLPPLRGVRGKNTRNPTPDEIEAYRQSVEDDIALTKPQLILGAGQIPLAWALGKIGKKTPSILTCRGRRFPIRIKDHLCWFYSSYHPSFVLQSQEERMGKELKRVWEWDFRRIEKDLPGLTNPAVEDPEKMFEGIEWVGGPNLQQVVDGLRELQASPRITIDVETNRDRPYRSGAKILSIAIGHANYTLALGIDHPEAGWTPEQKVVIWREIKALLKVVPEKVCHNTTFDLEWLVVKSPLGPEIIEMGIWHDTMAQAFILDEREGGFSLNYLLVQHFGFKLKAQSRRTTTESWMGLVETQVESNIDRIKLEQTVLLDVLKYNGLDTKYTDKLYLRQRKLLKADGRLQEAYLEFVGRVGSIVMAEKEGLPFSQELVEQDIQKLRDQLIPIVQEIKASPEVKEYEKRFGAYSPSSPDQTAVLFRDVLKRTEGQRGTKYSTDDEALSLMKDCRIAKLIQAFRRPTKLLSTYLEPADRRNAGTFVYPDGKAHTKYNYVDTDTGRFSSEEPNTQNAPKRKDAWIRHIVAAPPKHIMLSADYGALEVRGLAMASKDPILVKYLWTDYDTHMEWAKKIYKVWPKTFEERHSQKEEKKAWKDFRNEVKNEFVFPLFFGSSLSSASRSLEMPEQILRPVYDEFWNTFRGVKAWQKDTTRFYEKYGYVELLSGRRRHGPLSYNQLVNTSIQGFCCDLVVNAMNRIRSRAIREEKYHRAPVLMIHDDLSFFIPEDDFQPSLEMIVHEMCTPPWAKLINVPILIEVSKGPNWYSLKEFAKYRSDRLLIEGKAA